MTEPNTKSDRQVACDWARAVLADGTALIIDTETTGLESDAEIVQLAIINLAGEALLNTFVKPTEYHALSGRPPHAAMRIPTIATHIHHITDAMVETAPTFDQLWPELLALLRGRELLIYNADFDLAMLRQSGLQASLSMDVLYPDKTTPNYWFAGAKNVTCAMHWYSQWVGEWSDWHGSWRFQRLPGGDHSALGDARATLRVLERMAGVANQEITVRLLESEIESWGYAYSGAYAIADVLADLVGDLMMSDRRGEARGRLAADWFYQWRRDHGWQGLGPLRKGTKDNEQES